MYVCNVRMAQALGRPVEAMHGARRSVCRSVGRSVECHYLPLYFLGRQFMAYTVVYVCRHAHYRIG